MTKEGLQELLYNYRKHKLNTEEIMSEKCLLFPRVICNDGFSISIQANQFAYCKPRNILEKWTCMELGFPSENEDLIIKYAENQKSLLSTVYPYVPMQVIVDVINTHGGLKNIEDFRGD